ncbi:MAG TPA: NAD(P)/FAD-dependent oxidoreductase [Desulfobulbaceae bacterium]|nr:NAD(P)/FAD-dependent oxidoreductase [Desulfobulbaceae bacterium]
MADYHLVIIGAGLSGLAAGIRAARFGRRVLLLEQHWQPGGLNSFYFRQGRLLETGLHAMTNFAPPRVKHAPLNRLFRQLKLSRQEFQTHEQIGSEVVFPGKSLRFSNDPALLTAEIAREFPAVVDDFGRLVEAVKAYDPFTPAPRRSAREFLGRFLQSPVLTDMLLLPLMVYGNAEEEDMDLGQFVIMFRAIFLEGFFRPQATIKEFLDLLVARFEEYGGELRLRTPVLKIVGAGDRVSGVRLASGEEISAEAVLSTIGIPGTAELSGWPLDRSAYCGRMSFMETITLVPLRYRPVLRGERTIIFFNTRAKFSYRRPQQALDPSWGVICFPGNFQGLPQLDPFQLRVTNAANYELWKAASQEEYLRMKEEWGAQSADQVRKIIGNYQQNIVYEDRFTPVTIERFTAKAWGAVYGSPIKQKDGRTPFANLFIAGTDQGYLGIVGAMLSGVTIVNQHLLQHE